MRILLCSLIIWTSTILTALAQPEIIVNIPEYTLQLVNEGRLIKTYAVAVGTPFEQTPTGSYKIYYKEKNPTWYPGSNFLNKMPVAPGPDNPLGSRWMEFTPSYGIHGTNKSWDINNPVSGGCIRMQDKDAQELYELVPVNTPVTIIYETMLLTEKKDGLYLKILPDIYKRQTSTRQHLLTQYQPFSANYNILQNFAFEQNTTSEQKIAIPKKKQRKK
jgi:L,D-transpeptidase ErfK/SrfK